MNDLVNLGKFISLILRHKPELIGLKLDYHGWAKVDELLLGICLLYTSPSPRD